MVYADPTGFDPSRPRRFEYFCQMLDEQLGSTSIAALLRSFVSDEKHGVISRADGLLPSLPPKGGPSETRRV